MFKTIRILGISLVLAILQISHSYAAGYVGEGTIAFMQNAYGGWIMTTNGLNTNPDNCSINIVMLAQTYSQYKEVYSFLLSAYIAQKKVNIYVDGCHTAGYKLFSFVYTNWNPGP